MRLTPFSGPLLRRELYTRNSLLAEREESIEKQLVRLRAPVTHLNIHPNPPSRESRRRITGELCLSFTQALKYRPNLTQKRKEAKDEKNVL